MSPHSAFEAYEALRTRRAEVEAAVDDLIDILDAIDAATADIEPDPDFELDHDGEDGGDDELSVGAPEKHPSPPHRDFGRYVDTSTNCRQTQWAAGLNVASRDEGEVEDEHGGDILDEPHDEVGREMEPFFGAPENHDAHPDQEQWAQGDDGERGEDEPDRADWLMPDARMACRAAASEAMGQLDAIRRRTVGRGPDDVVFLEPGVALWGGRRR